MYKVKISRNYFSKGKIIAVTKYVNKEVLEDYYTNGFYEYGENRVDSFLEKYDYFHKPEIKWHFIGHLQRNKTKEVINKIDYLHSLESILLAKEIQKYANKKVKCFIEIKISNDENKYGILPEELLNFYQELLNYDKIEVIGLMCIASLTKDNTIIEKEFQKMNDLLKILNQTYNLNLKELSMGMSNDYVLALKYNATYLRIGSLLLEQK